LKSPRTSRAKKPKAQRYKFLKEFLANPTKIGAVAPSGRILSRRMVEAAHLADKHSVVEYGPGTGVISAYIIRDLAPDARYFAVELTPPLVEIWRSKFPPR